MKRIISMLLIALLICGTVSASAETAGDGNAAEEITEAVETEEGSVGAETEEIVETIQPDCSSWAVAEVSEAISRGLVPEHLQSDYQQPVTRGELAELTAYYMLYHKPEGTTLKEMWAEKEELWNESRELNYTYPEQYRYYEENVFSDTNEELYNRMYQFHYIEGYPDGTFQPDSNVKRKEAAELLWHPLSENVAGFGMPVSWYTRAIYQFQDIDEIRDTWYEDAVSYMWDFGCIKGYSDTIYGPEDLMTREQAIVTILRMLVRDHSIESIN